MQYPSMMLILQFIKTKGNSFRSNMLNPLFILYLSDESMSFVTCYVLLVNKYVFRSYYLLLGILLFYILHNRQLCNSLLVLSGMSVHGKTACLLLSILIFCSDCCVTISHFYLLKSQWKHKNWKWIVDNRVSTFELIVILNNWTACFSNNLFFLYIDTSCFIRYN